MSAPAEAGLVVDELCVSYGGLMAVDGVSLKAPPGRLTGLIGPNGAGKTTTFNACSGLVKANGGTIRLKGRDVTGSSPQRRASLGLGRTFQRMELFDSLTVRANVALGREAVLAGTRPWRYFWSTGSESKKCRRAADDALALCGIEHLQDRRPTELSTGQRRLVELARSIAGDFTTLLLDEPSSGLDRTETIAFGSILQRLAEGGKGILLVEHDMALVMRVCDYIYVLDFGKPIFEGTASEVGGSEVVRAAYLGAADLGVRADGHTSEIIAS
jgi:ABC-type branched-subunit amino acid transport system ATPase component